MRKIIILIITVSFSFNCIAQGVIPKEIRNIGDQVDLDRMQAADGSRYINVKGAPYLTDFFVPATIYPDDDLFFVKYNAVDDEIEVKLSATKTIILDNSFKKYTIVFKESKETFVTLNEEGKNNPSYFIEVNKTDNVSLYKRKTKNFIQATKATDNYSKDKPARFSELEEVFYIQLTPDGPVKEVSKKKKTFLKMFQNNQNDVKNFIGKNKIKLNKEEDLVKLISFISTL